MSPEGPKPQRETAGTTAIASRVPEPRRDRRIAAAISAGFALLALTCAAAIVTAVFAADAQRWATHSVYVREQVVDELSALRAAESAQRSFLLTRDPAYLEIYSRVEREARELQAHVESLTEDNEAQQDRLSRVAALQKRRLELSSRTIQLARNGDPEGALALVQTGEGTGYMRSIEALVREIRDEESHLDNRRTASAQKLRVGLLVAILGSVLTTIVLAAFVWRIRTRDGRELRTANSSLLKEISEHQRTGAQLRQSQKMEALGSLTGGLAHDFNNMLAIIVGSLDLLAKRVGADFAHRALIGNALDGARRAAALTQRLLAFSRLQPLDPRAIDVNKCAAEMSVLLSRTLGETIHIETVLGAGVWNAHVDHAQLESAILNLALNARDAMPDGGKLTIETSNGYLDNAYAQRNEVAAGQYVLIAITDTGSGMTPDVLAKAFDPFFTTKPIGTGTGLGLSQVHGFMKQSGGHVSLYSEPGVGTTVKLYLPRSTKSVEHVVAETPEQARDNSHVTILVVEDDPGVRAFAIDALRELGYRTLDAANVATALEILERERAIGALLTDVVMPEMNGRKLAERALLVQPNLKILYMTGYTRNAIVHNGVLDPGMRLLTKPFTVAQLDSELRCLLDERAPAPAPLR